MSATAVTPAELGEIDLLAGLTGEELERWAATVDVRHADAGEQLTEQGQPPAGTFLFLEGTALVFREEGGRMVPAGRQVAPTWLGAISVLTGGPLGVRVVAETDLRYGLIRPEDFVRLTLACPLVHRRVMERVGPVMSRFAAMDQERERLSSLGTMAAGVAHELNNPAAAATRAAAELAEAVEVVNDTLRRFVEAGVERSSAEELLRLQQEATARAASCTALDTLDAADAEDALTERLADLGVSDPWRIVEPLARANVDEAWLEQVAAHAGPATGDALRWVAATLQVQELAGELQEATRRMSELVKAIKAYTYMDQGDLVEIDLHEGLETTITLLNHKLKHTHINVVRDYDRDVPRLIGRGAAVNQVWTNLLDNAIAALGDQGTITITTRHVANCAKVDISDDGPGIPESIRTKVFDPFFTTKDVGQGTGLGLDTARRIVDRHQGSISVDSEPGRTTFHVSLPVTRP